MDILIRNYERKIASIEARIAASGSLFEKAYLYYQLRTFKYALSEIKEVVEL